jgi:hypothetical protein
LFCHPEWPHYRLSMTTELSAHHSNVTWKTMPRSKYLGRKTIKCRWVFDKKYNNDGTINKYKARLFARGFTQRHGIDYQETFAKYKARLFARGFTQRHGIDYQEKFSSTTYPLLNQGQ